MNITGRRNVETRHRFAAIFYRPARRAATLGTTARDVARGSVIAQIQNMDFLLAAAEEARTGLDKSLRQRRRRSCVDQGPLAPISPQEITEVIDELSRAQTVAAAGTHDPTASAMFMPREPILAILQTERTRVLDAQPGALVPNTGGIASRRIAPGPGGRKKNRERAFGPAISVRYIDEPNNEYHREAVPR
jgi:hypothetical protein